MMLPKKNSNYFFSSLAIHMAILVVFVVSFGLVSPMPVVQQSNDKQNTIQASVVTNIAKVAPTPPARTTPSPQVKALLEPKAEKSKLLPAKTTDDAIAITKKKAEKKKPSFLPDDLLADLKKHVSEKKQVKQKSLKTLFAKSLEQQIAAEKNAADAAKTLQMQGVINKYKALILQSISQHWLVPPHANKRMFSELLIRLAPDGTVLDVQLVKSSGDPALDRSARAAIFKASPLPVPTKNEEFEPFRQFALKVRPEDVLMQ